MKIKTLLISVALPFVAACGGSSTGGPSAQERFDVGTGLFETFVEDQSPIAVSALPPGSATYVGPVLAFGGVDLGPEIRVGMIGDGEIEIGFETGDLSGVARNFTEIENATAFFDSDRTIAIVEAGSASGELTFDGSAAVSQQARFNLFVNGQVTGPNGAFLNYVDVPAGAAIFGDDANAIDLIGEADATFDGENGFLQVLGVFERQ